MSDGVTQVFAEVRVRCPECGAEHCRPEWIDPNDPPETLEKTCIAPHPSRNAGFDGCGDEMELEVVEWSEAE